MTLLADFLPIHWRIFVHVISSIGVLFPRWCIKGLKKSVTKKERTQNLTNKRNYDNVFRKKMFYKNKEKLKFLISINNLRRVPGYKGN